MIKYLLKIQDLHMMTTEALYNEQAQQMFKTPEKQPKMANLSRSSC